MSNVANVDVVKIGGASTILKGDWIQTYTGRSFYPFDPRPEEVCIEDIARSLSMKCRYSGHTKRFYSVAEHSVHVSRFVHPDNALIGLLHDSAEAYSADIPAPIKRGLPWWPAFEAKILDAVFDKFGLPHGEPDDVKRVDYAMLADERPVVMNKPDIPWSETVSPNGADIWCWDPATSEVEFLERFYELMSMGRAA